MDQGLSPIERKVMNIINLLNNYSPHKGMYEYPNKEDVRKLLEKEAQNFILVWFLPNSGKYGLQ